MIKYYVNACTVPSLPACSLEFLLRALCSMLVSFIFSPFFPVFLYNVFLTFFLFFFPLLLSLLFVLFLSSPESKPLTKLANTTRNWVALRFSTLCSRLRRLMAPRSFLWRVPVRSARTTKLMQSGRSSQQNYQRPRVDLVSLISDGNRMTAESATPCASSPGHPMAARFVKEWFTVPLKSLSRVLWTVLNLLLSHTICQIWRMARLTSWASKYDCTQGNVDTFIWNKKENIFIYIYVYVCMYDILEPF